MQSDCCINAPESVCCVPAGHTPLLYDSLCYQQVVKQVLIQVICCFLLAWSSVSALNQQKIIPATRTRDSAACTLILPWCWQRVCGEGIGNNIIFSSDQSFPQTLTIQRA